MADLLWQGTDYIGVAVTYVAADVAGDNANYDPDGKLVIHIKNGGDADIDVTFNSHKECNQGVMHNQIVTVEAGSDRFVGPLPVRFKGSTGKVDWTYSAVTDVTVAAIHA